MPRISAFHGIVISMYHNETHGPPHFHVSYGEHEALVAIGSLEIVQGSLPVRQLRLVRRWAGIHQGELAETWRRARLGQALGRIEPLS